MKNGIQNADLIGGLENPIPITDEYYARARIDVFSERSRISKLSAMSSFFSTLGIAISRVPPVPRTHRLRRAISPEEEEEDRLRRVANVACTVYFSSRELIERYRDEHEGEFDGADNKGHERLERAERQDLRQDRIDVAKLPPARGEVQLHPVALGWPRRGNRNGPADIGMRAYTNGRDSA